MRRSPSIWLRCLLLICGMVGTCAAVAATDPAATLRAKHLSLEEPLRLNQFRRPLVLDSTEKSNGLTGDIYAIVDYPFGLVSTGLNNPDHWCDLLLLHINTKYCHAVAGVSGVSGGSGSTLNINLGKKTPEALTATSRVAFSYSAVAATAEYLEILLNAKDGPLGTSDYRIRLEAVALPDATTFLHLTYAYSTNLVSRLAMQAYLGTIGSDKVGFTVIGKQADGQPDYIGGVRGVVERNTMRYYLAIDSYLGIAHAASSSRAVEFEKRLQRWFTAVEGYSRQLHEMNRDEYLVMKRAEYLRQQMSGSSPGRL